MSRSSRFHEGLRMVNKRGIKCQRLSMELITTDELLEYKSNIDRLSPDSMKNLAKRVSVSPFPTTVRVPRAILDHVIFELSKLYNYERVGDVLYIKNEDFYLRMMPIMTDFVTFYLVKGRVILD